MVLPITLIDDPPVDESKDGSNSKAVQAWCTDDDRVMSAIVTSMNQSLIMSLSSFKMAKAMWSYLQKRYVHDSGALIHTLMQQIHILEQGDMSIDDYYSAFDRLMGPLMSMVPQCTAAECTRQTFIEKFFTYRFVVGVRPEFESIRSTLLHGSTLTMTQALSDFLVEETRLWRMLGSHISIPHSTLVAYQSVRHKKTTHR